MSFVARLLPAAALLLAAACTGTQSPAPAATATASPTASAVAAATPSPAPTATACAMHAVTPAVTEGPYFKAGSPEKTVLFETGMAGTHLVLTGRVLTATCQPVTGAVLDFWQADAGGTYDNSGYRLRGHQTVAADGSFRLETVIPGLYPGRTEHIHVKVQAPGRPVLTTQLFFPGVASNAGDSIFDPALLITLTDSGDGGKAGAYDFYVAG
jgi:protocatechuate 3,4-dioxygenase beta subunit